jgi:hypothetical protein
MTRYFQEERRCRATTVDCQTGKYSFSPGPKPILHKTFALELTRHISIGGRSRAGPDRNSRRFRRVAELRVLIEGGSALLSMLPACLRGSLQLRNRASISSSSIALAEWSAGRKAFRYSTTSVIHTLHQHFSFSVHFSRLIDARSHRRLYGSKVRHQTHHHMFSCMPRGTLS